MGRANRPVAAHRRQTSMILVSAHAYWTKLASHTNDLDPMSAIFFLHGLEVRVNLKCSHFDSPFMTSRRLMKVMILTYCLDKNVFFKCRILLLSLPAQFFRNLFPKVAKTVICCIVESVVYLMPVWFSSVLWMILRLLRASVPPYNHILQKLRRYGP